jgi:lipopolysaccharide transport system permease protein
MNLTPADKANPQQSPDAEIAFAIQTPPPNQLNFQTDLPVIVIEPKQSYLGINFRELWHYHELLYFLAWRDIKVRYKQTLLGVAWAILQPLLMMLLFSIFFGRLVRVPSDGVPYPLFAFAGLLPWTFLASAATVSGTSLVNSAHLITKVYFPRLLVPTAAVAAALLDFAITLIVLAGLLLYYRVTPTWQMLMLPLLIAVLILVALAFGVLTSALNVKYRDIKFVLPFLIQLWFFASPVIYPTSLVPERWRWVLALNPMTGIIEGFRAALFGQRPFDSKVIALSCVISLLLLICAVVTFKRMEKSFADIV